ncbi:hypothetical protein [Brevundimonas aveniformis]|uniref:hypothetical protein n=1 Tax=Brevundimonas aveniformis TaxID=370977 RepID=UPI00041D7993|nr:hypothetical protein [Brevundimonas aveniformis]
MRPILTLLCLILVACAPAVAPATGVKDGDGGPSTAPVQSPHALDAGQCAAAGGTMRPVCMMGTVQCVVPYADAGRTCRDGDDCQGDCRAETMEPQRGPVTGRCQANSDPCGCYANVEDGRVDAALCVD